MKSSIQNSTYIYNKRKIKLFPYLSIMPFFIVFCLFSLYPTIYSMNLSLFSWDGMNEKVFVGSQNFQSLFTDKYFYMSLRNTLVFFIFSAPMTTFLAFIVAFSIDSLGLKGKNFFKTVMFFPNVTIPVAVGVIFSYIFDWQYGIINNILTSLGIINEKINFMNEPGFTWIIVSSVVIWRWFGFHMVILLSALQSVDREMYEAARIDGARTGSIIWRITLPSIKPTIVFLFVTSIIGGLSLFDEPKMLYSGIGALSSAEGPSFSASTLAIYMYNTVFVNSNWGYGSAISVAIFIITLIISIIFYKWTRERTKG